MGNIDGGGGHKKYELIMKGHSGSWVCIPTARPDAQPDFEIAPCVFYYFKSQQQVETSTEFQKVAHRLLEIQEQKKQMWF